MLFGSLSFAWMLSVRFTINTGTNIKFFFLCWRRLSPHGMQANLVPLSPAWQPRNIAAKIIITNTILGIIVIIV